MAGYFNYSMSNNAVAAYAAGEMPASKAAKVWGFKSAKALRKCLSPSSWHHTSKFYNTTDFFDVESAYRDAELEDFQSYFRHLTKRGKRIALEFAREKIRANLKSDSFSKWDAQWRAGYFARTVYPRPTSKEDAIARNGQKRFPKK